MGVGVGGGLGGCGCFIFIIRSFTYLPIIYPFIHLFSYLPVNLFIFMQSRHALQSLRLLHKLHVITLSHPSPAKVTAGTCIFLSTCPGMPVTHL